MNIGMGTYAISFPTGVRYVNPIDLFAKLAAVVPSALTCHLLQIYKRGMEAFDQMNILQALLVQSALAERGETSQWILYSSITAVWRGNALPVLTQHQSLEIAAAVDGDFLSTGFMMFNSRSLVAHSSLPPSVLSMILRSPPCHHRQPELKPFLEKWDSELSKWTQQGIEGASPELVFDRIVKASPSEYGHPPCDVCI